MGKRKRKAIKTSIQEIVAYWSTHQEETGLSVDWAEAHERCWRCGCEKALERCHIIPHSIGGKDEPSNLVLLCKRCHADGPNVRDPEIMWDWIRAYGVPFYDTFWSIIGMKEYAFIYGCEFSKDLEKVMELAKGKVDEEKLQEIVMRNLRGEMEKTSIHFGQRYLNTATVAGVYRMMLKGIAKELGVEFPVKDEEGRKESPWWAL